MRGERVIVRSRILGAVVIALALLAAAVFAAPSGAAVIHKPAGTFDLYSGPGAPPPLSVGVDEQNGSVYVLGQYGNQIQKFDSEGNPSDFSGIPGPNEHQGVHFEGAWFGGDAFTLTCPNGELTGEIEWTTDQAALNANIKNALEAKCGGTLVVNGPGGDSRNIDIEFGGSFAHSDVAQIQCSKVSGTGTCNTTGGEDGAPATNKLNVACGGCYQIAVDNTGGPNQGVIYISSDDNLTTCCPGGQSVPNPGGGIHAYLPSGLPTHSEYKEAPVNPHPFEWEPGYGEPIGLGAGGLYTRSQEQQSVRACGVAVDGEGNLIIAHGESNQEYAYIDHLGILPWASNDTQEGTLLGTLNSDMSNPCRMQVDSAGNIYVMSQIGGNSQFSYGPIKKYSPDFHTPSGTGPIPPELKDRSTPFTEGPDVSFALDSEDHFYGLRPEGPARVQQLDQAGSLTETFGSGELKKPADITVNKGTGTVYVTDAANPEVAPDVHIYKSFTVPNSITRAFTGTTQTSGDVNGEVDLAEAGEEVTNCEFQYTTEALFVAKEFEEATSLPCDQGTTFTADESVSAEVSGLTLEETYKFRLVTENANGTSNGTIRSFIPHAVVNLATDAATSVAPRSATLNGSFIGNGDKTEYFFEIGHGPAGVYTETTPVQDAGEPGGPTTTPISEAISGLQLETTYHYRVVAINGTGESKGLDESFTTPPAVAGLTTEPVSDIGQETITLNAKFTGEGHDTKYYFEYGPTTSYGLLSSDEPVDAETITGQTPLTAEISTYYGYTTYHYRVVAENEFGVSYGKDLTFTTEAAPKPIVGETEIEQLTPTTATVSAMVTPNRGDASWLFEWGETTDYGTITETEPILTGITTESFPITATITGLEPATIYHFRAVAFNFTGVTQGADVTFKTPSAPTVNSTAFSAVTETSAHLSGRILSHESPTQVHFDFGRTSAYGSSTPASAIGSDPLARESGADIAGLEPGTTYHFRVVATNRYGTTNGPDQAFTTLPLTVAPEPPVTRQPPVKKKCRKGKVRKHGKCVKKHKPRRHKKRNKHHGRSR
jgi:hypothetical protein